MLPKKNRINKKEIILFFNKKKGESFFIKNIYEDFLTFRYFFNNQNLNIKTGVVISSSILKKAHQRNFLKRKTYLFFKKNFQHIPNNLWGIFIFNDKVKNLLIKYNFSKKNFSLILEKKINNILKKINEKNKS